MSHPLTLLKIIMFSTIPFVVGTMYALTGNAVVSGIVALVMFVGDIVVLRILAAKMQSPAKQTNDNPDDNVDGA